MPPTFPPTMPPTMPPTNSNLKYQPSILRGNNFRY
jgi:hypothetical protein